MRQLPTQIPVKIALSVAFTAVLNAIRIFHIPYGGTVSLVMLPLIIIALRRGVLIGMIAGIGYGVLKLMIEHWIVQPAIIYSMLYNLFVLVSALGVFAAAAVVLPALAKHTVTRSDNRSSAL